MPDIRSLRGRHPALPKMPPEKYQISARGKVAEITLYGVIGDIYDGITAKQVVGDLKKIGAVDAVHVHINSPGGAVTEGRAIYNRIKALSARKIVYVDGEASSIAALIAMVGDEIRMAEGSLMLVHRAWMVTVGNANDHRKTIADLETADKTLVDTFSARTGLPADKVLKLMEEDRYMDAAEALSLGFIDAADGQKMAALSVDREALHLPDLPKHLQPNRAKAAELLARIGK